MEKMLTKSKRISVSSHKRIDNNFLIFSGTVSLSKKLYDLYRVTNSQTFSEFMRNYRKLHLGYLLRRENRFKDVLRFAETLLKRERGTHPPNVVEPYRKDFGTGN